MSEAIGRRVVTTRKPHICFGCGREFSPGSQMERSFVVDDIHWTCYLCMTCLEVAKGFRWGDEFGFGDLRDSALEREATLKGQQHE